ncbi:ATP-binding protein [Nereida sp. MMG025]|uniref:ATP-binding protein n=1 Tax=Nereida sp. MMG025 TaxID=2909981 RepID=UPI001F277D33|nr:ATP-binding protein [Nereida sp. MMG025]MCF6443709.1 ATP-binding protein [Nereida sp. MMG025]
MINANILLVVSLAYVVLLFAVAFWADRRAEAGRSTWLRSPLIYTLSLSVYCTAWTFYGAVGFAARSGLEFITIYLGPTLVVVGWWWILRKLVRIGKAQRITSIADLLSSRYGKSNLVGAIVTILAVVGTTPYIALQLQSVTLSFEAFNQVSPAASGGGVRNTALWVAAGLALFTILFGTRNLDVNERHHGVVTAIAIEAIVKLFALISVGVFVVWFVADGPADIQQRIDASAISQFDVDGSRWMGLTFLAAAAFICLPRMFHVTVVENEDEKNLEMASWAFPLYLGAMSLFVIPIAVVGLELLPADANPDLFVLTVPLSQGADGLALLSFLGGFSSATSMVIVAALALATMVSNNIVMPLYLRSRAGDGATISGDVRNVVLFSRRVAIVAILTLGYLYYSVSGGSRALSAIGLISFAGVAQVLPALLGALFWRGGTRTGAAAGLITGFTLWAFTLLLPNLAGQSAWFGPIMDNGLFGLAMLRPEALLGVTALDPLVHAIFWTMLLNTLAYIIGSVSSFPTPLERLQSVEFVNAFDQQSSPKGWSQSRAEAEDLLVMAQRIIGGRETQRLFAAQAQTQGKDGYLPDITPAFIETLEKRLAGSVGAATAHAMMAQIVGGSSVSVEDLIAVADETAQMMEYSNQLEIKSTELERTARQLRDANQKLTALSVQKDAFLSQISHELRTPMTSIRAFSEILREGELSVFEQKRYSSIIHDEARRLTRLLDDLLDLAVLENGQVSLNIEVDAIGDILDRSIAAVAKKDTKLDIKRRRIAERIKVQTDVDRLSQVFINLIANAQKYCDADAPVLHIEVSQVGADVIVDFIDNGSGIDSPQQAVIFEKFSRLSDHQRAGGAGLGLAICREIVSKLGGTIRYLPGHDGAAFRVTVPKALALAAQ